VRKKIKWSKDFIGYEQNIIYNIKYIF